MACLVANSCIACAVVLMCAAIPTRHDVHPSLPQSTSQQCLATLLTPPYLPQTPTLQALFRPMAMMIPDYALVAEVMLFSEGFEDSRALSRKMVKLYKLASEQLSQQVRWPMWGYDHVAPQLQGRRLPDMHDHWVQHHFNGYVDLCVYSLPAGCMRKQQMGADQSLLLVLWRVRGTCAQL